MKIGYHYTTCKVYDTVIAKKGLTLRPVQSCHHEEFGNVMRYVQEGAIWLYKSLQLGRELISTIICIAAEHGNERICLLQVEYEEDQAASILATRDSGECTELKHTLYVGTVEYFGYQDAPIELLNKPVSPERIKLIDEWNLNDLIRKK